MKIKLAPGAMAPSKARASDAGYDLYSMEYAVIEAGQEKLIDTGVSIDFDFGRYDPMRDTKSTNICGFIMPRSSIRKTTLILSNGVGLIDPEYRGTIKLSLRNIGNVEQIVHIGDRLAQLVITEFRSPNLELFMGSQEEWENTDRGGKGFGSSGR